MDIGIFLKYSMQVVDQSIAAHVDNKLLNKTVKEDKSSYVDSKANDFFHSVEVS